MPKYSQGDSVIIDGQQVVIGSWPDDDTGPFTYTYKNREGGDVYVTNWASQVNVETPVDDVKPVVIDVSGDPVEPVDAVEPAEEPPAEEKK